ncbi:hypothetical protein ES703_55928 [subsurface metagenome]
MKKASLISFAVLSIFAGQAVGGWCDVQIVPEHPTSCDVVVITLSGWWGDSCTPNYSAISRVGNNIYFDVIWDYPPGIICAAVITPWGCIESVGPLPAGTYTVYASLNGYPPIPPEYTPVGEFTVTDKQFVLSTELLTVPEGGTETFTVALLLEPAGTVEVSVARESGDTDITVQSGGTLFFDPCNYLVPQMVTLAAAEDEDYLDGAATIRISAPTWIPATVIATESDNYYVPPVLYVDADANGNNDGRSWADAYVDLQEALALASYVSSVEEIRVAEGVYKPAGPGGSEGATFQLISAVAIKGGYAGFGESDPNTRDIRKYETILSGDLNGDDGPNFANNSENSYHVVTGSGSDATAILDGFTITAGKGGGSGSNGGGMYNRGSATAPTVANCTFKRNSAAYGAGVYCSNGSSLTLTNCTFSENVVSWYGGGIECWCAGDLTVTNCTFNCNSAGEGGGIYSFNTNCTLINCIFSGNSAVGGYKKEGYGGGVYNKDMPFGVETVIMINCTFIANSAVAETGGGIYDFNYYYNSSTLTNCILWANTADDETDESAQIYADNKIPVINYCCIQGWTGALGGTGNIGDNPLFADPDNDDYHLQSQAGRWDSNSQSWVQDDVTSSCIDAADMSSPIGFEPFPNGGVINMGAYGGTAEASKSYFGQPVCETIIAGDINGDCKINLKDFALMAYHWLEDHNQ